MGPLIAAGSRVFFALTLTLGFPQVIAPPREGSLAALSEEETIAYLTRCSPRPPDGKTLLLALCAAALAFVLVWIFARRKRVRLLGAKGLAGILVLSSLLGAAHFAFTVLRPHFQAPPLAAAREGGLGAAENFFDQTLEAARRRIPARDGILLVNCDSPRQAEWTKYCLYPRRIVVEAFSLTRLQDPGALLDAGSRNYLQSLGAQWVLDCAAAASEGGAARALLEVRSLDL